MTRLFGQLVVGPPGSGKTSYVKAMADFYRFLGRCVVTINLDSGNETNDSECDISIEELINLQETMSLHQLGPNGGLLYTMDYLLAHIDWLSSKISSLPLDSYVLIDTPGQVELLTTHGSFKEIVRSLESQLSLVVVHLVDAHYTVDAGKFISVLLSSLSSMLHFALPHINVLSKVDLIEKYGKTAFNIDYYTDVLDLDYLIESLDEKDNFFFKKYKKLNEALSSLIFNYSLVSFTPLSLLSKEQMLRLKNSIDKANGYVFGVHEESKFQSYLCQVADSQLSLSDFEYFKTSVVRETFMGQEDSSIDFELNQNKSGSDFQI